MQNFQKFHTLDEQLSDRMKNESREHRKNATSSPSTIPLSRSEQRQTIVNELEDEETDAEELPHFCRKATNPELSPTDLIMFGMYRLTPEQDRIYQQFVNMLSEFNRFDMVRFI